MFTILREHVLTELLSVLSVSASLMQQVRCLHIGVIFYALPGHLSGFHRLSTSLKVDLFCQVFLINIRIGLLSLYAVPPATAVTSPFHIRGTWKATMTVVDKQPVESPLTRFCGSCEVANPTPNLVSANYELQAKQPAAAIGHRSFRRVWV